MGRQEGGRAFSTWGGVGFGVSRALGSSHYYTGFISTSVWTNPFRIVSFLQPDHRFQKKYMLCLVSRGVV